MDFFKSNVEKTQGKLEREMAPNRESRCQVLLPTLRTCWAEKAEMCWKENFTNRRSFKAVQEESLFLLLIDSAATANHYYWLIRPCDIAGL
jgi:hypothetical protein